MVCELIAMAGGVVLLVVGQPLAALGVLFAPVQLLFVLWLSGRNLLLLGFFSFLLPLAGLEMLPGIYRDVVMFGTLFLTGMLIVVRPIAGGEQVAPLSRIIASALVITSICVLASAVYAFGRGWGSGSMIRYSVGALFSLLATWVFSVVPESASDVRRLVHLAASALVLCCLLLPYWALAAHGFEGSKTVSTPFGMTTLNLFGFFVAPMTLVLLGMSLGERKPAVRVMQLLGSAVLFAVLIYTRSRGAWLGFGAGILYLFIRRRSFGTMFASILVFLVLLSLDAFRESIAARAEQTGISDPSIIGRVALWWTAVRMAVDNCFAGVGAGAFNKLKFAHGFPELFDPFRRFNTHSFYLEILVGLGLAGFLAYFTVPLVSLRRLLRLQLGRRGSHLSGLALGLSAAVICFLVHGLVESPAWHAPTLALWGVLLGLSLATASFQQGDSANNTSEGSLKARS